ncbi:molybdate ABC transporter substrate-binding protein [Rapidithrix thailandica]|uniref:Molybdate ABC transporter substrate-binding protein n=1 Tax=Rapidithrix thailandica TaxID=413964 RepID=A0AAW9SFA2_9BACT
MNTKRRKRTLLIHFILATWTAGLLACSHREHSQNEQTGEAHPIVIATAANMQFAMQELTGQFTKSTGIDCEVVISSSGKLTAQIKEGAPYDVFVSANRKYPDELYKSGLAREPTKIYAYGKLVLWSMFKEITPSVESLSSEMIEHIALANPKTAPYGVAAIEVLKHYQLSDKLEGKLVYGESIAQTNQFIISKSAELGFTAMSVVLSPDMQGKGHWVALEEGIYTPIEQGVVVIQREKAVDTAQAQKFYEFLFSKEARQILESFGYSVDE